MKVLVVGSGGREHAIAWALRRSPRVREIHIAPGNGGTGDLARNVPIAADNISGLVDYCRTSNEHGEGFDLAVIGPEIPLALGLSDALQGIGVRVFGPSAAAARLETSKEFSKDFMRANHIPTPDYRVFKNYDEALRYLEQRSAPIVVKASGLAAGKGAIVCRSINEARAALNLCMRERAFGAAGDTVVIEECLRGQEVSVLAFCDGQRALPMILAQDHKAAYDGDQGPNTGGMGAYAPAPLLDDRMMRRVMDQVLQPAMDGLRREGTPYVGVLYAGLMLTGENPRAPSDFSLLEFNCRFGDPEAQAILPLLETDLLTVMEACIDGRLDQVALRWANGYCVCVVAASGGYPGHYEQGLEIRGVDSAAARPDTVVFHAGTKREGDRLLTAGGRVLGVTSWADSLQAAIERAYAAVDVIHWPGMMFRRDIGEKGL